MLASPKKRLLFLYFIFWCEEYKASRSHAHMTLSSSFFFKRHVTFTSLPGQNTETSWKCLRFVGSVWGGHNNFTLFPLIFCFVSFVFVSLIWTWPKVNCVWNVMAHAQKPNFVFQRNGRVHLNRRGRRFCRLLAAEICTSAVVMLDTPCSEVVWRLLVTHSIRQFPLHFPSRASPCSITFQL
jgi:hypothetical protein